MEKITVDNLLPMLKKLSEMGKGDMEIKCGDGYLHKDEISFNYLENCIELRGNIFNTNVTDNMMRFCSAVEKAKREYLNTEWEE